MPVVRKKVQAGGADTCRNCRNGRPKGPKRRRYCVGISANKATVVGFAPVVSMARSTGKLQE
jgi:hypothetical protein